MNSRHRDLAILVPVQGRNFEAGVQLRRLLHTMLSAGQAHLISTPHIVAQLQEERPDLQYVAIDTAAGSLRELLGLAHQSGCLANADLLVIPAGATAESGVVEEMRAVLAIHEKHAIVMPRSNCGGLTRVPLNAPPVTSCESALAWQNLLSKLPRFQVVPWAEDGCLMIRHEAVTHFGLFREGEDACAYSSRINRYGYSTVIANRAFVSMEAQALPCVPDAAGLQQYVDTECDPVDYFGALALRHRPRLLYDLSHLAPQYYGTADFALNLLRGLRVCMREEFDIVIDIRPEALAFFLPELQGYALHQDGQQYDVAFKPTQINAWSELEHINRLAPRIAYTILDMIAVRCQYLAFAGKRALFQRCAELCDRVFALSDSVGADFAALTGSNIPLQTVLLATNYGVSEFERMLGEYVLVMGNAYAHKGVFEALEALAGLNIPVKAIGAKDAYPGVSCLPSGSLTRSAVREVLAASRVLVYPSHYEGFGLPVLDALALGKPVVVLDNQTNRELANLTNDRNLHLIPSLEALPELIVHLWSVVEYNPPQPPRHWLAVAQDYLRHFCVLLARDVDYDKLRSRWTFLRTRHL